MSSRFLEGIRDVKHGHLYELANTGSDHRDFPVARSIDVITVATCLPSHICIVIADMEFCSTRTTLARGSPLLMEVILGWGKSHSAIVTLF